MKLERVGEHWERVEWSGAVGERLEIWDWTEKDLGGTGGALERAERFGGALGGHWERGRSSVSGLGMECLLTDRNWEVTLFPTPKSTVGPKQISRIEKVGKLSGVDHKGNGKSHSQNYKLVSSICNSPTRYWNSLID